MKSRYISLLILLMFALGIMGFQLSETGSQQFLKSVKVTTKVDGKSWQGQEVVLATAVAGQLHIEAKAKDGTAIKLA